MDYISTDELFRREWGIVSINATIIYTWIVMVLMVVGSWLGTRRLSSGPRMSRWQNLLEVVVGTISKQIREVSGQKSEPYIPFIGTLFLFIVICNLLSVVPGWHTPTGSFSTTTALAICVFLAVPIYGVQKLGLLGYLKQYLRPTPLMLPFNVIGELSRTLALAVRLFGNVMSGGKIAAILLAITPLFVPVVMHALGLLTGVIQAYIFAILAMVYIASATKAAGTTEEEQPSDTLQTSKKGESAHG